MAGQEKLEKEQTRAREEAKRKARRDRRCKVYHDLFARQQQPPNPWDIQHLFGSYIMRWHGEEPKKYGDLNDPYLDADVMRINVFPCESSDGVKPSFWFGMFDVIMLIAKSRRKLERFRNTQPKGLLSDEEGSDSDTSDEEPEEANRVSEEDENGFVQFDKLLAKFLVSVAWTGLCEPSHLFLGKQVHRPLHLPHAVNHGLALRPFIDSQLGRRM